MGPSGPVKVKPVIGAPRCPEFGLNSSLPRVGPRIGGTVDFHHDARFWGCEGAPFISLCDAVALTISVLFAVRLHWLRVLVCSPFPRAFSHYRPFFLTVSAVVDEGWCRAFVDALLRVDSRFSRCDFRVTAYV